MARITVEDCLVKENNRFALVQLASKRTKQLLQGSQPLITEHRDNKSVVVSLREIADGKVRFMTAEEAAHAEESPQSETEVPVARPAPSFSQNGGGHGGSDGSSNGSHAPGGSSGDDSEDGL